MQQQQQQQQQQQYSQPAAAPAAPASYQQPAQPAAYQQPMPARPTITSTPIKTGGVDLARMAQDGFVSSANNGTPGAAKLGAQYGNANQSQHDLAAQAGGANQAKAPPSGDTSQVPPEQMCIITAFKSISEQLEANASGAEKRQVSEIKKACLILFDKLNVRMIHQQTIESLIQMTNLLSQGDFKTALSVHVGLTSTDW